MARETLAKRLGDQLNSIPLETIDLAPERSRRQVREARRANGIVSAVVFLPMMVIGGGALGVYASWWGVKEDRVCVVEAKARDTERVRGGTVVTWSVVTDQCGTLEVTSGGGKLGIEEVDDLATSLVVGTRYRFDVRGWGELFGRHAILHAKELPPE